MSKGIYNILRERVEDKIARICKANGFSQDVRNDLLKVFKGRSDLDEKLVDHPSKYSVKDLFQLVKDNPVKAKKDLIDVTLKDDLNFIEGLKVYIPQNYEAQKYLTQTSSLGFQAKWCIGVNDKNGRDSWNDYIKRSWFLVFIYNANEKIKITMQVDLVETQEYFKFWDSYDRCFFVNSDGIVYDKGGEKPVVYEKDDDEVKKNPKLKGKIKKEEEALRQEANRQARYFFNEVMDFDILIEYQDILLEKAENDELKIDFESKDSFSLEVVKDRKTQKALHSRVLGFSPKLKVDKIEIPTTYEKMLVEEINVSAFKGCLFKEVVIPDNIRIIRDGIFEDCTYLTNVTLPTTIDKLPSNMFKNCRNLKEIFIPSNIKKIGFSAFENCVKLQNVIFEDQTFLQLNKDCFKNTGLESFQFKGKNLDIGPTAFQNCQNLKKLNTPQNTKYSYDSFDGCSRKEDIEMEIEANKF